MEATERLERHLVSNARLQAEVLLAHCISQERTYLYTHDDKDLTTGEEQCLEEALYDRVSGVPLQYIVGRQEFYGRDFTVNRDVLIPRPETEYVVQAVLDMKPGPGTRILDIGTGSGCIAVTLALELSGAEVFASDISEAALRVARSNAAKLGADVSFVCMDMMEAVYATFDFIVSNPPYVKPGELSRLQREVREHEPHVALFSKEDGIDIYLRLISGAETRLSFGGHLIMEVGMGMDERVLGLSGPNWERLPTKCDLQGIPRTVVIRRVSMEQSP
jgi:release factor glutamine methyltransferase